jgi:hypothetical protein
LRAFRSTTEKEARQRYGDDEGRRISRIFNGLLGREAMARHNREASGSDQRGFQYTISYQPDWLGQVKVTRLLGTGRQSTKTLFSNPDGTRREPGQQVRTGIRCEVQGLVIEVAVTDPGRVIRRLVVETEPADGAAGGDGVQFTIEPRE